MEVRFLPYATTPGRALGQGLADVLVAAWVLFWIIVGWVVHWLINGFAVAGRAIQDSADGVAGGLNGAGGRANDVPLVGDKLGAPLNTAGAAAHKLAEIGAGLESRAQILAWVLALAVSVPPVLTVVLPWAWLRTRFARRAAATVRLARTPGGERLLALRALTDRPLPLVLGISSDPVTAYEQDDATVVHRLAALELRASGIRPGRTPAPRAVDPGQDPPPASAPVSPPDPKPDPEAGYTAEAGYSAEEIRAQARAEKRAAAGTSVDKPADARR